MRLNCLSQWIKTVIGPLCVYQYSLHVEEFSHFRSGIRLEKVFVLEAPIEFFNVRVHNDFGQIAEFVNSIKFETRLVGFSFDLRFLIV
jgi:hypothetical protein